MSNTSRLFVVALVGLFVVVGASPVHAMAKWDPSWFVDAGWMDALGRIWGNFFQAEFWGF
jgi:hypothetical protein